jgi:hypothetical protein
MRHVILATTLLLGGCVQPSKPDASISDATLSACGFLPEADVAAEIAGLGAQIKIAEEVCDVLARRTRAEPVVRGVVVRGRFLR